MGYQKFSDIPPEIIQDALDKIDEGMPNFEISKITGLSNYYLTKIRRVHGRPASKGKYGIYTQQQREQMIELLWEGNSAREVSEITGVEIPTLHRWRRDEVESGNNLPIFEKPIFSPPPPKYKYSDEEIVELIIQNPGFGLEELLKILYSKSKSKSWQRHRIMQLLEDYKEYFNEDLYAHLQDPEYVKWITKAEYKKITGSKYLPKGYAGKGSSGGSKANPLAGQALVPLTPQNFNWGEIKQRD